MDDQREELAKLGLMKLGQHKRKADNNPPLKYSHKDYLEICPFIGDEGELTLHTSSIVKTRKEHICVLSGKTIPSGSFARHDKALVDGDFWGSYYISIEELNRMLDEQA